MIKKEKFIKDVMFSDARQGYQFFSSVKKDYEKEKNVLSVKLSLVCKVAQIFQAGCRSSSIEDLVQMAGFLKTTLENQIGRFEEMWALNKGGNAPNAGGVMDIKEAVKEYILAKDLMKKKIIGFISKHRSGIIKTRAAAAVDYMKKNKDIPNPEDEPAMAAILQNKETEILMDIVYPELAKKTEHLEDTVNRLVAWRARVAAMPAASKTHPALESEKLELLKDFIQAVKEVKTQALEGSGVGEGIFKSPDGLGMLGGLKSNLNEQRMRANHFLEFIIGLKTNPEFSSKPMHEIEGSSVAQAACDKMEELMKDERNIYVDLRKWEPEPGRFFLDMSDAVKFPS